MNDIVNSFTKGLYATTLLEYVAVVAGIASVWFSKKENILVYPVGLINTTIYIYISFKYHLLGEASVNLFYTIMSIYGWALWAKKDVQQKHVVYITASSKNEWLQHLLFFIFLYMIIYFSLSYLKQNFMPDAIPWADAFASATAFTGMWLMARKKVESWYWWIATNIASIPLYFVKHLVFTSVYYFILLILAFFWIIGVETQSAANMKPTVKKIVILGPESTGKSTLCEQLSAHYKTVWCPEFAREYLTEKGTDYSYEDLLNIAMSQIELEDMLLNEAKNFYFIDTDMYVMKVWCEVAFENCHTWILKQIASRYYDMHFLCDIDLPWVQDELREYPDPDFREKLFKMYKDFLINDGGKWAIISGSDTERLQTAISIIDTVFNTKRT